jgi:formylglycine-generating enzyme required for sulfatase activity/energy-coupling factor transporter ATP-binding protein EcfA2
MAEPMPTDVDPFHSLITLREAHRDLLHWRRDETAEIDDQFYEAVGSFVQRAQAAGAIFDREADRRAVQSLLDYWDNELYHAGHDVPESILAEFDPLRQPDIPDEHCPYVGLEAFAESQQSLFFGREPLVEQLMETLASSRLVALIGPSGSGKSSAALAGLLPKLREGKSTHLPSWHIVPPFVPGSTPLSNLLRALCPAETDADAWLAEQLPRLRQDTNHLAQLAAAWEQPLLLVIDQFEELFTLCFDENERRLFVDSLLSLTQERRQPHSLILTMRTDYENHLTTLPLLHGLVQAGTVRVTPMNAAELRDAILRPAEAVGLRFEEGLVTAIVNDIVGEPAALPLLQFTLLQLWHTRERNRITWAAYRRLGGVLQALATVANQLYEEMLPEEQITFRRIMLRLVQPGEGLEVTRQRLPRQALYKTGEAQDRVDRVLEKLVSASLIHLTPGSQPQDDQVEVAHEALVRNWPRLVNWLDEARLDLRQRRRVTTQAVQWDALGRDAGALLRGTLLREAEQYDDLNPLEQEFVAASRAAVLAAERHELAQAQAIAAEQQQRAEAQAMAARRLRQINMALLAIFTVVLVAFLLLANNLRLQAREQQARGDALAAVATQQWVEATSEAAQTAEVVRAATVAVEQTQTAGEVATSQAQNFARATTEAQNQATAIAATAVSERAALEARAAIATATAAAAATRAAQEQQAGNPTPTPTPTPGLAQRLEIYADQAQLESSLRERDNMRMLYITGGEFMMGADPGQVEMAATNEQPAHPVTVADFYLDRFEVTVQQYAAFLNAQGGYRGLCNGHDCVYTGFETQHTFLLSNLGVYEPKAGFENYPVNWVSWHGADSYCRWVDARLPTEAEWEYAAGGVDGRLYPWGDEPANRSLAVYGFSPTVANFDAALRPVNALPEGDSPFGLAGMAGSLLEWVQDWYDPTYYATRSDDGPNLNNTTGRRVLRGGAWYSSAGDLRLTARFHLPPRLESTPVGELAYWGVGFRCARDAE